MGAQEQYERSKQKKKFRQTLDDARPTQDQIDRVLALYQAERFAEAEALAVALTEHFPEHPFAWQVLGTLLEKTGRSNESLAAMQKVVELNPRDGNGHSNLGVVLKHLGRLEEAEASLRKAVALNPDSANSHNNLGNMLRERGSPVEAEVSLRKAIELQPDHAEAHNNLGATLRERGCLEEARDSLKKALALKPDYAEAHNNLGNTLRELGALEAAKSCLTTAISLKPDYAEAYTNLGVTLTEMGCLVEAEVSFRKALALRPDYGNAEHMLAALTGETTSAAPLDYVEHLFDGYASSFDASLVDALHYRMPQLVAEMLLTVEGRYELGAVLDMGCGTGLLGAQITGRCARLEGVDISEKMLAKAREKGIYDHLVAQDLVSYLSHEPLNFDFFIATDVFVYVGDLCSTFQLIKSRNRSGGRLVFSTEHQVGDGYTLQSSGRYAHSKAYIERLGSDYGYELKHFELQNLRLDKGEYIQGGLYLLSF